jgi:hypothetical protein
VHHVYRRGRMCADRRVHVVVNRLRVDDHSLPSDVDLALGLESLAVPRQSVDVGTV